jgi:predicted phosphodiesterase
MSKVLVIGDIHEPATHVGYRRFCQDLYDQWGCNSVLFIGDIIDHLNISFHQKDVDADGVTREADMALKGIQKWYKAFPKAEVMIGNHDERVYRLSASVNIPARFIRDYSDVWNTPKWDWKRNTVIDDVHYFHGTGCTGKMPALNAAKASMMSTVIGHCHSVAGIKWSCGVNRRIFGMDTGCGVDINHVAMNYGRNMVNKPVLAAGVVLDGFPYHEIMPMARGEKYHKSRFTRKTSK